MLKRPGSEINQRSVLPGVYVERSQYTIVRNSFDSTVFQFNELWNTYDVLKSLKPMAVVMGLPIVDMR
jgi:hypothetical protein